MKTTRSLALSLTILAASALTACGGGSSEPAAPAAPVVTPPVAVVTPTPAPTPAPAPIVTPAPAPTPVATYISVPDVGFQKVLIALGVPVINGQYLSSDGDKVTAIIPVDFTAENLVDVIGKDNVSKLPAGTVDIKYKSINSLIGIEGLANLTKIVVQHQNLTSVDVSKNKTLKEIGFWDNKLSSIDLTQNPTLELVSLDCNDLSTIDLTKNVNLKTFGFSYETCPTRITPTSIDFSKNTKLERLYLSALKITTLDLSQSKALNHVYASFMPNIVTLDLSNKPLLNNIGLWGNASLTYLNIKGTANNGIPTHLTTADYGTFKTPLQQITVTNAAAFTKYVAEQKAITASWTETNKVYAVGIYNMNANQVFVE